MEELMYSPTLHHKKVSAQLHAEVALLLEGDHRKLHDPQSWTL
jgi:hypothetical protein